MIVPELHIRYKRKSWYRSDTLPCFANVPWVQMLLRTSKFWTYFYSFQVYKLVSYPKIWMHRDILIYRIWIHGYKYRYNQHQRVAKRDLTIFTHYMNLSLIQLYRWLIKPHNEEKDNLVICKQSNIHFIFFISENSKQSSSDSSRQGFIFSVWTLFLLCFSIIYHIKSRTE